MSERTLAQALETSRLLLCVGTGGVGKTTIAAALALAAARRGRRVAVLTIDPARRLADALGDGELGDEPRELSESARTRLGLDAESGGRLHACTLDSKRTFDRLVERFAPDEATRERIFSNVLYQHAADALAGSAEYAAMERVYEIVSEARFDLVVVDTPPAQHALDFLDAPKRLGEFLESRLVQGLLHPAFAAGRFGLRIFERGARRVLGVIERVSGLSFLEDLSEFLIAIESLATGFRLRAGELSALLRSADARFLLVTGPARDRVRTGERFVAQLAESGVSIAGIVANRVSAWPGAADELDRLLTNGVVAESTSALERALEPSFGARSAQAAAAAISVAKGYASQVRAEQESLAPLRESARRGKLFFVEVPELEGDVHDLSGLIHIERALVSEDAE